MDLPRILGEIKDGIGQTHELVQDIADGINSVLSVLPEIFVAGVRAAMADLVRMFDEVVAGLQEMLSYAGSSEVLRATGAAWTRDIGGVAGTLAGTASVNVAQADDRWTGVAAEAYAKSLLPQQAALVAVKTTSDEIDAGLQEVASAIDSFWVKMLGALGSLVAGLAAAAISAGTVAGAPLAPVFAAAGLVGFAAFGASAAGSLSDISNGAAERSAALQRRLLGDPAYPEGRWPRSTTDLSDGSITDGDDTDWHVR